MATCAFASVYKGNKILLVRIAPPFSEARKWNLPGGVIEKGEEIREGLIREVAEETGILCTINNIRDNFTTTNPDNDIYIFNGLYLQGEIAIQETEILEAKWFTAHEALGLDLAFNIREYIDQI